MLLDFGLRFDVILLERDFMVLYLFRYPTCIILTRSSELVAKFTPTQQNIEHIMTLHKYLFTVANKSVKQQVTIKPSLKCQWYELKFVLQCRPLCRYIVCMRPEVCVFLCRAKHATKTKQINRFCASHTSGYFFRLPKLCLLW